MVESCANPNYAIQAECYINEMPNGGPGGTSPPPAEIPAAAPAPDDVSAAPADQPAAASAPGSLNPNPIIAGINGALGTMGNAPGEIPSGSTQEASALPMGCKQVATDGSFCDPNANPNAWDMSGTPKPTGITAWDPNNPPMQNGLPQVDPENAPLGFLDKQNNPPPGWVMDGDKKYVPVAALQQRFGPEAVNNPQNYTFCENTSGGCLPNTPPINPEAAKPAQQGRPPLVNSNFDSPGGGEQQKTVGPAQ